MERNGATVYGPSVRVVGATAARMLRAEAAGSAEGEGRPGTPSAVVRARM